MEMVSIKKGAKIQKIPRVIWERKEAWFKGLGFVLHIIADALEKKSKKEKEPIIEQPILEQPKQD